MWRVVKHRAIYDQLRKILFGSLKMCYLPCYKNSLKKISKEKRDYSENGRCNENDDKLLTCMYAICVYIFI